MTAATALSRALRPARAAQYPGKEMAAEAVARPAWQAGAAQAVFRELPGIRAAAVAAEKNRTKAMAAETAQAPRAVRAGHPVRAARHSGEELPAEPVAPPASRAEAARASHRARVEAVPTTQPHARGMTAPAKSPRASRLARGGRPAPARRCPRSKPAAPAPQAETTTRLRTTGTEGITATATPQSSPAVHAVRAVRVGQGFRVEWAGRAGRAAQTARYRRKELAPGAGALRRLQAEAEAEAEQEAPGDSQAPPPMRAEAVAAEPQSFPAA
jgi:hypothetical protein